MAHKNNKILDSFNKKLSFLCYADSTIASYVFYLSLFLEYADKPLSHITHTDAYDFLEECVNDGHSAKNQIISSLKLFYKHLKNTELSDIKTQRPRKKTILPRVIDHSVLESKFRLIKNVKHRTMIELGYRCGLRVSEVCSLRISDIDSTKMQILIRNSKGNKDGYVPVSDHMIRLLRNYWKKYRPQEYLFEGQRGVYSTSSCQKIFKKYIEQNGSWHKLRHSYATTLLEKNINLKTIQESLRHKSSRTTEIYLHVSNRALQEAAL